MRTIRIASMVVLSVALLGIGNGASAEEGADIQDTGGPFEAMVDVMEMDDWVIEPGPPHGRMYDWEMVMEAEASDPRLSGTWTLVQNLHAFGEPGVNGFTVSTGTARLENAEGAWVGDVLNFYSPQYERIRLVVEGEGDYAGLTAVIDQGDDWDSPWQGLVLGYGLPPLPDPVEPPAE